MDDRSYQNLVDRLFNSIIAENYTPIETQALRNIAFAMDRQFKIGGSR